MRDNSSPSSFSWRLSRQQIRWIFRLGLAIVAIVLALILQYLQGSPDFSLTERAVTEGAALREPIQPIENNVSLDPRRVALGERLFREPMLSQGREVACINCHKFEWGGAEKAQFSEGTDGALTAVNTPTVYNVAYNFRFNWDGKHESLAAHTNALIQNPNVMGAKWPVVQERLMGDRAYQKAFAEAYDEGVNQETVIDAIVAYEESLMTPNAPFDQYLRGDREAISPAAKQGYDLFKAYGCVSCHQGVNIGGNMFQKFGVMGDYFADRGGVTKGDLGRYNVTGEESDRHVFRVPSLRNVATTAPYLHDGSAETLTEAIKIMVKYQLGRPIPEDNVELIAQFLQTLTGEYRGVPVDAVAQ